MRTTSVTVCRIYVSSGYLYEYKGQKVMRFLLA